MQAAFKRPDGRTLTIADVPSEQVARLVAACCGFRDLDLEPMEPGRYRLTATGPNRTVTYTGTTVYDVCEKLIDALAGERCVYQV